jgi:hypothetical protein
MEAGRSSPFVTEPILRKTTPSPAPDETQGDVRGYIAVWHQNFPEIRQQWVALIVTGMFSPPPVVQNE